MTQQEVGCLDVCPEGELERSRTGARDRWKPQSAWTLPRAELQVKWPARRNGTRWTLHCAASDAEGGCLLAEVGA